MSRKKILRIPFDSNGDQPHCAKENDPNFQWRDNEIFQDVLVYFDYKRTKHSVWFLFKRHSNGKIVTMMLDDLSFLLRKGILKGYSDGIIGIGTTTQTSSWTWKKRGNNFAVSYLTVVKG